LQGLGFKVEDLGFRVCGVKGPWFKVENLGFGVGDRGLVFRQYE